MRQFLRIQCLASLGRGLFVRVELLLLFLALLFVEFCENINNLAAAIITAVYAYPMREHGRAAMGAGRKTLRRQRMVRPHAIPLAFRMPHPDNHNIDIVAKPAG